MQIELHELAGLIGGRAAAPSPWEIGKPYFIRTVTHHLTGRLVAVHEQELVLEDAAWIADDGRFSQAITTGSLNEVEPFPRGSRVIVGRGSLIDACTIDWPLPTEQK
jgi:hypothetical protein